MSALRIKDRDLIEHILGYCHEINETIERFGDSYDVFINDRDYIKSVSMSVFQITELSGHLATEVKQESPILKWDLIRGMRNRFAHGYSDMDYDTIWDTAKNDIPDVLAFCNSILRE